MHWGFGFVEMAEPANVAVAYSLLNNIVLNGQSIRIEPEPSSKNGKAKQSSLTASRVAAIRTWGGSDLRMSSSALPRQN
jgi:RNA recognition motif-containing protein